MVKAPGSNYQGVPKEGMTAFCNGCRIDPKRRKKKKKGFMRRTVALTDLNTDGSQPDVREGLMI